MLMYCDHCATKNGYDVDTPKTAKGECELCRRRLGPMNVMEDDDVEVLVNNIDTTIHDFKGGFHVEQVKGFPVGIVTREIEPKMSHKMLDDDVSLFYDTTAKKLVVARQSTGDRIQITF